MRIARRYRDSGAVNQQTLLSLGRLDVLQASGQLDALLRSGLRWSRRRGVLDAQAAGQTEAVVVKKMGPERVFGRLWEQRGIAAVLAGVLRERRYEFEVERASYLTVLPRLFASGSDRAAERWRAAYRLAGADRLELPHLYRARAFLGQPLPQEPNTLGRPRGVKDRIEEALFERRRDLFPQVDRGFFGTTSI